MKIKILALYIDGKSSQLQALACLHQKNEPPGRKVLQGLSGRFPAGDQSLHSQTDCT